MRRLRDAGLACLLLAFAPLHAAHAQAVGRIAVDSAVMVLGLRLQNSPEAAAYIQAAEDAGTDPFEVLGSSFSIATLPDSVALSVLPLFKDTMADLPQDSCGTIFTNSDSMSGEDFDDLLSRLSHPLLERWMGFIEAVMLSNARGDLAHPRPSVEEAQQAMIGLFVHMEPDVQERFMLGMEDGATPAQQCQAFQILFGQVSESPVPTQLLIVRANFP